MNEINKNNYESNENISQTINNKLDSIKNKSDEVEAKSILTLLDSQTKYSLDLIVNSQKNEYYYMVDGQKINIPLKQENIQSFGKNLIIALNAEDIMLSGNLWNRGIAKTRTFLTIPISETIILDAKQLGISKDKMESLFRTIMKIRGEDIEKKHIQPNICKNGNRNDACIEAYKHPQ